MEIDNEPIVREEIQIEPPNQPQPPNQIQFSLPEEEKEQQPPRQPP